MAASGPLPPVFRSRGGRSLGPNCPSHEIRFIPFSYSAENSRESAVRLVTELRSLWEEGPTDISFERFTDGITNTLLKATNSPPGKSRAKIEADAILLRAYGHGTDVLIDRQREAQNHELLSRFGLAPELLARFKNGMMYRFIEGSVTQPDDLRRPEIYRAVARRLAQWHATVPCLPENTSNGNGAAGADRALANSGKVETAVDRLRSVKPIPNLWTIMQKWILALPTKTEEQKTRQANLQQELDWLVTELGRRKGLGENGLVFAHCDLLSGNIIVLPRPGANGVKAATDNANANDDVAVAFIDYEYATPSPAAFDIANHFAEWGGFDCDYSVLPTCAQRREFIAEYIRTFFELQPSQLLDGASEVSEQTLRDEAEELFHEVDIFRGVPGFYWGIWALIQATISDIDFDYATYAETRLGEYWAWREATKEAPRERRWAQEE